MNVPYSYNQINSVDGTRLPVFAKIHNTGVAKFFKRYLFQQALSKFKFTLPQEWDADYFRYILFGWGFISVFKTDKFGVIPQQATLSGLNVFYRPTDAIVANPLIESRRMRIGEDCSIIRLMPDYGSISDLVDFYGDLMALSYETAAINILNSRVSFVFDASNKADADTAMALFDEIVGGKPSVVYRRNAARQKIEGSTDWRPFTQDVKQSFIAPEVVELLRSIRDQFLTEIGIPSLSTRKKQRVNVTEAVKNNAETNCKARLWLQELEAGIEKTIQMFPELAGKLAVKMMFDDTMEGGVSDAGQTERDGVVFG